MRARKVKTQSVGMQEARQTLRGTERADRLQPSAKMGWREREKVSHKVLVEKSGKTEGRRMSNTYRNDTWKRNLRVRFSFIVQTLL